jgi:nucleoside phosphorylase
VERAAAIQMLDEDFGMLQYQDTGDTNTYTLGRIGHHYVAIACLPDGQYGTTSATIVANNMMRTFSKSMRIGLMVGIGGGIPSSDHDIRLGDIVVSRPNGSCGGVVQHDMGKIGQGGKIQRTGSLNNPPRSLLTALSQRKSAELYKDPLYPSYVQQAIEKNARTRRNFGRPDLRTDRLFQIEYEHPVTAPTCDRCPAEWEETRLPREESDPQKHYGIIASGNTVIKNGAIREQIRQETGALCCEMEAAGLMADFPCIVIRGIYDYADSHKNKQWQGYAALTAAAYAKELLSYVPRGILSQEKLVTDVCGKCIVCFTDMIENGNIKTHICFLAKLEEVNGKLGKAFDQRESHHRERVARILTEDQHGCHQTFKTSSYEQYKNINPDRVEGTCEWVLKSSEYRRWWESCGNDLLWISADPGCGKSVLAKSLIDEVFQASAPTVPICYFFFKDNDEQNNLATALCAILHQLFMSQPQLLRHALPFWQKNREKIQQEVEDLWRIFMAATSDPTSMNTICVFDALDECRRQDQKRLIGKLQQYYAQPRLSPPRNWLKFLVTSRPYDEIQEDFQPVIESFPQIHLRGEEENDQIHNEISLVVKVRVAEIGKKLKLKAETQARLEKVLLQMEHRTYLWLYLVIDDIQTMLKDSLRPDQESVPLIPKSVNEAYQKILDRVTPEQEATVRTILQIIVGARRPLSIPEMTMALGVATAPDARRAEKAGLDSEGLGERIRRLCGLFVFIKDSRIYLIHQTAREFLINKVPGSPNHKWYLKPINTEVQVTQICVKYLLMDDLVSHGRETNTESLLEYSAQNWPDHFREISSPMPELVASVHRLYDYGTEQFSLWFPIFWTLIGYPYEPKMSAVHVAAFNGHHDIIGRLLMNDERAIDRLDGKGMTALQWACLRGHYKCTLIFTKAGR